jgi:peptide/nickel transport system permease protein
MVAAVLRRLTLSALALLGAGLIIFLATNALPNDAATAVLGREAVGETLAAMRHEMGLDQPLGVRFLAWITHVIRGDLGITLTTRQPAWQVIEPALTNSAALGALAVLFTVPMAVVLGVATGLRRGTAFDHVVSGLSLATLSLPEFVIGILLAVLFGILWPLFPATSLLLAGDSSAEQLQQLVLPALAAGGVSAGYILRMTRASTIEVLESSYVASARLRGIDGIRLIRNFVVRNSMIPVINVIGANVAWMFGSLVVIETVFGFPGIGTLLITGIRSADSVLVADVAMIITFVYIVVNLIADFCVLTLDPRMRENHGSA